MDLRMKYSEFKNAEYDKNYDYDRAADYERKRQIG